MFEGGRGGIEEVVVVTGYGEGTEEVGLKKILFCYRCPNHHSTFEQTKNIRNSRSARAI